MIFWGLFLFLLAGSAPNLVPDSVTIPIRGSVCFEVTEPDPTIGIVVIVLYVLPPLVVVGVFAFLTIRLVQKRTVESKKIVEDVLIIMVSMVTVIIIFRLVPLVVFLVEAECEFSEEAAIASWLIQYSADFSYTLFLFHILFIHKTGRNALFKKLSALKCSNVKKMCGRRSGRVSSPLPVTDRGQAS